LRGQRRYGILHTINACAHHLRRRPLQYINSRLTMYCPKCGRENPEHFKFCLACGEDLSAARDAATSVGVPTSVSVQTSFKAPEAASALVKQMMLTGDPHALAALARQLGAMSAGASGVAWTGGDQPLTVAPPPAPRALPGRFWREHISPTTKIFIPFGGIFASAGALVGTTMLFVGSSAGEVEPLVGGAVMGGAFLLIGGSIFAVGMRHLLRTRHIWRVGHAVIAQITEATFDMSTKINGRRPVIVRYSYTMDGVVHRGEFSSMHLTIQSYSIGQPVHVLYDPSHPERSVLCHGLPAAQGAW
jgi:hypothetical protein